MLQKMVRFGATALIIELALVVIAAIFEIFVQHQTGVWIAILIGGILLCGGAFWLLEKLGAWDATAWSTMSGREKTRLVLITILPAIILVVVGAIVLILGEVSKEASEKDRIRRAVNDELRKRSP